MKIEELERWTKDQLKLIKTIDPNPDVQGRKVQGWGWKGIVFKSGHHHSKLYTEWNGQPNHTLTVYSDSNYRMYTTVEEIEAKLRDFAGGED